MDRELASTRQETNCRRYWRYGRVRTSCDRTLRFLLDEEKHTEARDAIRKKIKKTMNYDTLVGLIELPTGGYNIVTSNLRSRDGVQGLVDPSFIAFSMASYTKGTGWRSRDLQIWIQPYEMGWAIPTSGSRIAIEKGLQKSQLGFLGVVNIEEYRKWLQKNFRKLEGPEQFLVGGSPSEPQQRSKTR
jgi:hypothetical protein